MNFVPAVIAAAALIAVQSANARDNPDQVVTGPTPYAPDCNGVPQTGTLYPNAEVEPFVAANPRNPLNLVGVWQQDRWSSGGSQGLGTAWSFDGGLHWRRVFPPWTRCAGGAYERGSDPWVGFSPNGVAHQMVLVINQAAGDTDIGSAMLVSRSLDGGRTWSAPVTLQADTPERFNDKNTLTADPTDSRYVYAVWDRLSGVPGEGAGPTLLARSTDNGASWEPTRIVFDPGPTAQTIGNRIEVLPDGTLVNLFTLIDYVAQAATLQVIRSTDKGQTWSAPIPVADVLALGAFDPETGFPIRDGAILAQMAISPQGRIAVVWQDSRFSGFQRDGVAYTESTDGGRSWSAPVQINAAPEVQAFTPSVHARRDGTFGVTYRDLRSNTADPATLPVDTWLTRSRDGLAWRESRVAASFDLAGAPVAGGLFLGDYEGLTSVGPLFVSFHARSTGDPANRNDIHATVVLPGLLAAAATGDPQATAQVARQEAALPLLAVQGTGRPLGPVPEAARRATLQAYERLMQSRGPAWERLRAARAGTN